jgi:hypothetical protein
VGGWVGWGQSGEERGRGQLGVKLTQGASGDVGIGEQGGAAGVGRIDALELS